tara:strand:+ start:253 stop:1317 length:1065 start_codon:yes stop_codon:yes gene_type:complete
MAEAFETDIAADIAASKFTNFPEMSNLRASERRQLINTFDREVAPAQDRLLDLRRNIAQLQTQNLQFKNLQLQYEESLRQSEQRRLAEDPVKLNEITEVLSSDKSATEQKKDLLAWGTANANLLLNSPLLAKTHSNAIRETEFEQSMDNQARAGVRMLENIVLNSLVSNGEMGLAQEIATGQQSFQEGARKLGELAKEKAAASRQRQVEEVKEKDIAALRTIIRAPKFEDTPEEEIEAQLRIMLDKKSLRDYEDKDFQEQRDILADQGIPTRRLNPEQRALAEDGLFRLGDATPDETRATNKTLISILTDDELLKRLDLATRFQERLSLGRDPSETLFDTPDEVNIATGFSTPE